MKSFFGIALAAAAVLGSLGVLASHGTPVPLFNRSCTVGFVGTAMTETLEGPATKVACEQWVKGNPKKLFLTDEPRDQEHHILCRFDLSGVSRTVRDTGMGVVGYQRCQQLANGQAALT